MHYNGIEKKIQYKFKNILLIKIALTHTSVSGRFAQTGNTFEHLEFLGDRVLGLIISELLIKISQNTFLSVKDIAICHTKLVSGAFLIKIAEIWNLKQYLKHSIENLSNSVLTDTVEAVIAAIYLDSDYKTCFLIVENFWMPYLKQFLQDKTQQPKTQLQEFAQANKTEMPVYRLIEQSGEAHKPCYEIEVSIKNFGTAIGLGESKQIASKNAAINLLKILI